MFISLEHFDAVHHERAAETRHFLRRFAHAVFDPHLGERAHAGHDERGAVVQLFGLAPAENGQELIKVLVLELVEYLVLKFGISAAAVKRVENVRILAREREEIGQIPERLPVRLAGVVAAADIVQTAQEIVLMEFDGPQERTVFVDVIGE